MDYEKAWELLKANFFTALAVSPVLSQEEGEGLKRSVLAAISTMEELERICSKEKDDRATDRPRVEN
uniref:hypothetical protein n=1 Tax=Ndongobacter massiliensis TaxID=1871025 RepID=UPI0009318A44|nr:hypothetical protein [Ndongobacter massiliensis]